MQTIERGLGSNKRHNAYGTVAQRLDASHYGVLLSWGQRVEAVYYRTEEIEQLDPADHVFLQIIPQSSLWVIIGHAYGTPGSGASIVRLLPRITQSISVTESAQATVVALVSNAQASDSLSISESAAAAIGDNEAQAAESIAVSENALAGTDVEGVQAADSIAVSEAAEATVLVEALAAVGTDSLAVSENAACEMAASEATGGDTVTVAESAGAGVTDDVPAAVGSDAVSITESATANMSDLEAVGGDSVSLAESATGLVSGDTILEALAAESIAVSENAQVATGAVGTQAADSVSVSESAAAVILAAVAHDASSESHTGSTGSTNEASFTWNHTPVGTPKGVLVFTFNLNSDADDALSVTYGGQSLAAVTGGLAADTLGEPGRCKAWFLGTGIPTGVQAVVVNRNNNANIMYAVCVTVTTLTDTEVTGVVLLQEDGTLAEQNVDDGSPGVNSMRYAGVYYGQIAWSPGANSTTLQIILAGSVSAAVLRENTAGQGSRPVGGDDGATVDDRACVHLAVRIIPV